MKPVVFYIFSVGTALSSFWTVTTDAFTTISPTVDAFVLQKRSNTQWSKTRTTTTTMLYSSDPFDSAPSDVDDISSSVTAVQDPEQVILASSLKNQLLQMGASYDRGYGASPSAREEVDRIINEIEALNFEIYAARGIQPDNSASSNGSDDSGDSDIPTPPLQGAWRMVWTTAQDVLVLGASPLSTVGAIYQVFDFPIVTNIIDLLPKAQSLLPPGFPASLLRAEVTTRAFPKQNKPNRIGLNFESVKVVPKQFLGMEVTDVLPPIGFDLPQIPGSTAETSPGYFDVTYLDEEMLIIRQNSPGGIFVLVKVPDADP